MYYVNNLLIYWHIMVTLLRYIEIAENQTLEANRVNIKFVFTNIHKFIYEKL